MELFRTLLMQKIEFFDRHSASELQGLLSVELDTIRSFVFRCAWLGWGAGILGLVNRLVCSRKGRAAQRGAGHHVHVLEAVGQLMGSCRAADRKLHGA